MKKLFNVLIVSVLAALAGCANAGLSSMEMGKGGSVVTGAAGSGDTSSGESQSGTSQSNKVQGASNRLEKCDKPIATIALAEASDGYAALSQYGLPNSPLPLAKLLIAQTGCFKVVNRGAGLSMAQREHSLAQEGYTSGASSLKKGKVLAAKFTLTPQVMFANNNAGGGAAFAGIANAFVPGAGLLVGGVRFGEAQVMITVTDNQTLEEVAIAEGSAKSTDISFGGMLLGGGAAAGAGAWSNTAEGKIVAAALMDAINNAVRLIRGSRG